MQIAISKAQRILPRLIRLLRHGEEIVLTKGKRHIPVVRLELLSVEPTADVGPAADAVAERQAPYGYIQDEMDASARHGE